MSIKISKKCPRCGEVDLTDFSTCRFCRKKYVGSTVASAVTEPSSLMIWALVLLVIGFSSFAMNYSNSHTETPGHQSISGLK
jgi:hypothetical protein